MLWIVLSWVLFVVLGGVAVAALVGSAVSTATAAAPTSSFAAGKATILTLDPADKPAIYASGTAERVNCNLKSRTGEGLSLTQPPGRLSLTANGKEWVLAFAVGIPEPDEYRVTCEGAGAEFGVGRQIDGAALAGSTLLWIALPVIGFVVAVVTTIIVLVKRGNFRKRALGLR